VHLEIMDPALEPIVTEAATTLDAVRRHDRDTFSQLVVAHDRDLVRFAYIVAGSRDAAEDAVQATWERLWRKPPHLRDASKLYSWLLSVCANEARQANRRRRRGVALEAATVEARPADEELRADLADLHDALSRLTPGDRELLGLRFAVGLRSSQIAEQLGLSPAGARTRLHRLLQHLRQELRHG
jgi:RNA polymerase sigma factor (sigma-70 family)